MEIIQTKKEFYTAEEDRQKATLESTQNTILQCITAHPRYIPHWYQYDTIGSELFDNVAMKNPYYHLYRAEKSILKKHAGEIAGSVLGPNVIISELGAGSSTKTVFLLEALLKHRNNVEFIPIDIAKEFMEENAKIMRMKYKDLTVTPFAGDYADGIRHLKGCTKPVLLIFLGSSFSNVPLHCMISFLTNAKNSMKDEDRFVIGIDLTQNHDKLKKAYTHPATFGPLYKNILVRLNHDFDADFDLDNFVLNFDYVVSQDTKVFSHPQYVQMSLRCLSDQTIHLKNIERNLKLKKGEKIYGHELENLSVKWNWQQFTELIEKVGFCLEKKWTDQDASFGLACLRLN